MKLPNEQELGKTIDTVDSPHVLVRVDWMRAVHSWLDWTFEYLRVAPIAPSEGVTQEQAEIIRQRGIEQLTELKRLLILSLLTSPIVLQRRELILTIQKDPGEDIPMPPPKEGELGS
jgi:hypothetical protein